MNHTQLVKDDSIINLLKRLDDELGEDFYDVVDHWEADLVAIGIASPKNHGVLVYITTMGCKNGVCEVHLELPSDDENEDYIDAGIEKNLDFKSLIKIIENHFEKNT